MASLLSTETVKQQPAVARLKLALRRQRYNVMLMRVEFLLKTGRAARAREILSLWDDRLIYNMRTREAINAAFAGRPSSARITKIRHKDFSDRLAKWIKKNDLARVLWIATQFEAIDKPMPRAAGAFIERAMVDEEGRLRLRTAAKKALKHAPFSPFLVYLYAALHAKAGEYVEAGHIVQIAMDRLSRETASTPQEKDRAHKTFAALKNAWRVVDVVAREQMGWIDKDGSSARLLKSNGAASQNERDVSFKEPLLQARNADGYLGACLAEFESATTLHTQVKAVADMLRQSVRRQYSYHKAYALADKTIDRIVADLAALTVVVDAAELEDREAVRIINILLSALRTYRTLGREADVARIKAQIESFAAAGAPETAIWLALPELVLDDDPEWVTRSHTIRRNLPEVPGKAHEIKAYFKWALWVRAFDEADRTFRKIQGPQRESASSLYYVNILQRQGRFAGALDVLDGLHVRLLSHPGRLNPFQHWNLLRRRGELSFLRDTADAFAAVPQPQNPKGVLVIAARNVDQLRKYPLVVLMELRRRGWAAKCLVEGLLPNEPTGNPDIDLLGGCITLECRLSPAAEKVFPELTDFVAAPHEGRIEWMGLNLHHSLMEDARINRRAYDVDFSCPALTSTLQKLCDWTELAARATVFAHSRLPEQNIRAGFAALFNSRLPDTLFRLYCEKVGDPETFFALQTANGYENYFANFSHEISTRCVIRNVTAFPEVRSASFPRPAFFEDYYQANYERAEEIIARVEHIATAKRTSGPVKEMDPDAAECEARIHEWRAKGGKVACLFGRVVCDSAVPFDGGPAHADFKEWLLDSVDAVRDSNTLLLIKPHPHELNEEIATYLNQYFFDLLPDDLPDNVVKLGHRWFDITALSRFTDLGVIYNGTVAIEMSLLNIPCIQANHFGPIDYPVKHHVPRSTEHYHKMLRFEAPVDPHPEMRARAALWLDYMSNGRFALDYCYHARPVTNKVVYPPYWLKDQLDDYLAKGDPHVSLLADRVIGTAVEPVR